MPDDVPTAINLGGAYILHKKFEQAIAILEKALEIEPDNEMIWTNLGAAYLGNPILASGEQQSQAIQAFERAIEINPVAPNVHYNLGLIHRDRGETEKALLRFRQAIQANPNDQDARRATSRLENRDDTSEQDQCDGRTGH
jgi:tetratricopeptide (TPR) repeat protein